MAASLRVAVLISGRGSNMEALIKASREDDFPAEIVLVLSNRPEAAGLRTAESFGIETKIVDHKAFSDRESFESEMSDCLRAKKVDFIALAGFMRLMTEGFVAAWRNRMINIHPSLLPLFPGLNTHERALEAGVKLHGCSVHFVRHEMDSGPLIGQAAVPVLAEDTPDSLAARVLAAEHRLYPLCLRLIAEGRVTVEGERARVEAGAPEAAFGNPAIL